MPEVCEAICCLGAAVFTLPACSPLHVQDIAATHCCTALYYSIITALRRCFEHAHNHASSTLLESMLLTSLSQGAVWMCLLCPGILGVVEQQGSCGHACDLSARAPSRPHPQGCDVLLAKTVFVMFVESHWEQKLSGTTMTACRGCVVPFVGFLGCWMKAVV